MRRKRTAFCIIVGAILFSTLACLSSGRVSTTPPSTYTATSTNTPTLVSPTPPPPGATATATSIPEPKFPPSTLNQTAAQLESIQSYQANLVVIANGTKNGEPVHWKYSITQSASAVAKLKVISVLITGLSEGNKQTETVLIEKGERLLILSSPESNCVEEALDLRAGLFDTLFDLLPDFGGAQKDKSITVDGILTDHYSISGGQNGLSGEMWLAKDGGFLVQANLKQEGELPSLGLDLSGSATWEYQLTRIDQPVEPVIPKSCNYLLGGFPLPDDAGGLAASENSISFTSAKNMPDLSAFFSEAMKNKGWELPDPPVTSDDSVQMIFVREMERVFISMLRRGEITYVQILNPN